MKSIKIFRISTVSHSLSILLKDQFHYLNKNGFEFTLMCYPDDLIHQQVIRENAKYFPLYLSRKLTPISDLKELYRLVREIYKCRPQIVHTHSPKAGLVGMLAAKLTGVKCKIHTVAGLPLVEKTGAYKKMLIQMEKLCYYCSDIVIFNSPNQAEMAINSGWINRKKVRIVGSGSSNGIDTGFFSESKELKEKVSDINIKLNKRLNDLTLVFIGRIARSKGIEELVNAFLNMCVGNPNLHLVLVGSYDETDPVSDNTWQIIQSELKIHWFDFQEDVRPFFLLSDIFVFPSYREGFPQVIMQACSMGCAIVATDINGANEIIDNKINGILISPKSSKAIEEACNILLKDDQLRHKYSSLSRHKITEKYDQKMFWKELEGLYRSELIKKS